MKSKTLLLLFFTLTLTYSFSIFAQSRVCENPLAAICSGDQALESMYNKRRNIRFMSHHIRLEAESNAQPKIAELRKKFPDRKDRQRVASRINVIMYKETMKSAKTRMANIETIVTSSPIISYLKNFMKIAINESSLDEVSKHNFKRIVDTVIIGNFSDLLKRADIGDDDISGLGFKCNADGLSSYAFATVLNNQRYVIVCPGYQMTMHETPNMQERINNILITLSHEIAHHFDNSFVGNKPYDKFINCIADNYGHGFNKTKSDEAYCDKNGKFSKNCKKRVALSHSGELIADMWANKVLAIYARGNKLSIAQTDYLLMTSYMTLCDFGDEGIHPTSDFRIEKMLRLTPEISDYLSCDNSRIKKPACTLEGEVRL